MQFWWGAFGDVEGGGVVEVVVVVVVGVVVLWDVLVVVEERASVRMRVKIEAKCKKNILIEAKSMKLVG